MNKHEQDLQKFVETAKNQFAEQMKAHLKNMDGLETFGQKCVSNLCKAAIESSRLSHQMALKEFIESKEERLNTVKKTT